MSEDNGGAAFPFTPTDLSGQIGPTETGMSLRDYFAGQALAHFKVLNDPNGYAVNIIWNHERIATACYDMADAMLKARKND